MCIAVQRNDTDMLYLLTRPDYEHNEEALDDDHTSVLKPGHQPDYLPAGKMYQSQLNKLRFDCFYDKFLETSSIWNLRLFTDLDNFS